MTNKEFYREFGNIDPKMIEAAAPAEKVQKKKKNGWVKWASMAACFALLVSASLWLFVPGLGTSDQAAIYTSIKLDDVYCASYLHVNDMSNFDKLTLESKIGDLYLETETQKFYKLKGHDDIAQLIAVTNDGVIHLLRFSDMNYWEKGAEPFSFGYLLENIFNVKSVGMDFYIGIIVRRGGFLDDTVLDRSEFLILGQRNFQWSFARIHSKYFVLQIVPQRCASRFGSALPRRRPRSHA